MTYLQLPCLNGVPRFQEAIPGKPKVHQHAQHMLALVREATRRDSACADLLVIPPTVRIQVHCVHEAHPHCLRTMPWGWGWGWGGGGGGGGYFGGGPQKVAGVRGACPGWGEWEGGGAAWGQRGGSVWAACGLPVTEGTRYMLASPAREAFPTALCCCIRAVCVKKKVGKTFRQAQLRLVGRCRPVGVHATLCTCAFSTAGGVSPGGHVSPYMTPSWLRFPRLVFIKLEARNSRRAQRTCRVVVRQENSDSSFRAGKNVWFRTSVMFDVMMPWVLTPGGRKTCSVCGRGQV